jgi:hypothetical protein
MPLARVALIAWLALATDPDGVALRASIGSTEARKKAWKVVY